MHRTISLLAILFFSLSALIAADDVETTIVVIDGKALLVDVDETGKVVTTYMEVGSYFEDSNHHDVKVAAAKIVYKKMTELQMDQIRFIAFSQDEALDDVMVSNISDLSLHYQQTYANEIVITAPRNRRTASLLEVNINKIKKVLVQFGVSEEDIFVDYKIDMGDEPTRFVKVISHLRNLPAQ